MRLNISSPKDGAVVVESGSLFALVGGKLLQKPLGNGKSYVGIMGNIIGHGAGSHIQKQGRKLIVELNRRDVIPSVVYFY